MEFTIELQELTVGEAEARRLGFQQGLGVALKAARALNPTDPALAAFRESVLAELRRVGLPKGWE